MTEYHGGPYRGPISGGLPGLLVVGFSLVLMTWLLRTYVPVGILIVVTVATVAFFFLLRWRGR
jgi:hypothetical protein